MRNPRRLANDLALELSDSDVLTPESHIAQPRVRSGACVDSVGSCVHCASALVCVSPQPPRVRAQVFCEC